MWGNIAKWLFNALKTVGTKAASKVASSASGSFMQQAGKTIMGSGAKAGEEAATDTISKAVDTVGSGKNRRRVIDVIGAILGDPMKNLKNQVGAPEVTNKPINAVANAADGMGFENVTEQTPLMSNYSKPSYLPEEQEIPKMPMQTQQRGKQSIGQLGNLAKNLLGGETFSSKMFLNTVSNLGRQGAFSGSEVGQPDKNFGGMLANSLASSLGTSAAQQREQNYTNRQNLLNMASDINISEDIYKEWSPKTLERINNFKTGMVNMMYDNRKRGINGLSSNDMMQAQLDYLNVKKDIDRFNTGIKTLNDATQTVSKDANNTWDVDFYNQGIKYFKENGRPPAEGFLKAAPKDPKAFFPQVRITPISQWSKAAPENNFMRSGVLTDEQKQLEAIAQLNSNAGVRRWAEENGYDPNNTKDQIRFGLDTYQYIEQPQKDDYAEMLYQDKQQRLSERAEDRQMATEKEMPYNVTGNSIVFKKNTKENVSVSDLRTVTGGSFEGDEDELLPVTFESIDSKGNLTVSAKTGSREDAKVRRYIVPPAKAKELTEAYYPGVWKNVEKMYKAPKEPVGVEKMFDLPGYGKFTYSELRKQGWSDEDIKRLK